MIFDDGDRHPDDPSFIVVMCDPLNNATGLENFEVEGKLCNWRRLRNTGLLIEFPLYGATRYG
jgi:hypothetical protein